MLLFHGLLLLRDLLYALSHREDSNGALGDGEKKNNIQRGDSIL